MAIFNTVYGGEWHWTPWSNTIAYYPLTSVTTTSDMKWSWTAYNLTKNWTVTFWTNAGVDCASFNSSGLYNTSFSQLQWTSARTYNFWAYDNKDSDTWQGLYIYQWTSSTNKMVLIARTNTYFISQYGSSWNFWNTNWKSWNNHTITYDGTKFEWLINWVSKWTWAYTINTQWSELSIWKNVGNTWWSFVWYISNVIVENKVWTSDEITKYYNSTKANYS